MTKTKITMIRKTHKNNHRLRTLNQKIIKISKISKSLTQDK